MRGTRYGDFSRPPVGARPWRQVLSQQGRVQLDSDWNAQSDQIADQLAAGLALSVGDGVPDDGPGFEVRPVVALSFDGHGWAEASLEDAPFTVGKATFEVDAVWRGGHGTILSVAGARHGTLRWFVGDDGRVGLNRWRAGGGGAEPDTALVAGTPLTLGRRTRLAAVCAGTTWAVYADGAEMAQADGEPLAPAGDIRLTIGAAAGGEHGFRGLLRDVRVWSSARTARQLAREEEAAEAGDTSGGPAGADRLPGRLGDLEDLVAAWPMDDASGRQAWEVVGGARAVLAGPTLPAWALMDLNLRPGPFWLGGMPLDLGHPLSMRQQPVAPGAAVPSHPGNYLVYLETWERSVSALEDPSLGESALGGLDTTVRTEPMTRVGCTPLPGTRPDEVDPEAAVALLGQAVGEPTGRMAAHHEGGATPGNYLYRVEVHHGGDTGASSARGPDIPVAGIDVDAWVVTVPARWLADLEAGEEIWLVADDEHRRPVRARQTVAEVILSGEVRHIRLAGTPAPIAGHSRHRIHRSSEQPTFKWSRRNGSEVVAVRGLEAQAATVEVVSGGPNGPVVRPGHHLEVLDPRSPPDGPGHPLLSVADISEDQRTVVLGAHAGGPYPRAHHHLLRLWDHPAPDTAGGESAAADGAIPIRAGDWADLEAGIRVQFHAGTYRRGDYWWIVSRENGEPIEWPRAHGRPVAKPPDGVERRRSPLALLRWDAGGVGVVDLRARAGRARKEDLEEQAEEAVALEEAVEQASAEVVAEILGPVVAAAIPAGLSLVGPPDAEAPGFVPTDREVVTRGSWEPLGEVTVPEDEVEHLVAAGGRLLLVAPGAVWEIRPDDGHARSMATFASSRRKAGCAEFDGTLYLAGGTTGGYPDRQLLALDMATWTFAERAELPHGVNSPAVAVLDGRLHVLGGTGHRGSRSTDAHSVYDPKSNSWAAGPPLPGPRTRASAAVTHGRLHIFGGSRDGAGAQPLSDHYLLEDGAWHPGPSVPMPAAGPAAGGHGIWALAAVTLGGGARPVLGYDPRWGTWELLPPVAFAVNALAAGAHNGAHGPVIAGRSGGKRLHFARLAPAPKLVLWVAEDAIP